MKKSKNNAKIKWLCCKCRSQNKDEETIWKNHM